MSRESLTAQVRDAAGKSPVARRLRKTGMVPGVIYQHGDTPVSFAASERELTAMLRHGVTLLDVDVEGTTHTSVIKDYQVHPVRGNLMHIDLQAVRMDEVIRSTVSVNLVGTPAGENEGGVLTTSVHELNIESKPGSIPESIGVDVSALGVGDSISLADVTPPEGVVFTDDLEATVIASVAIPAEEPAEVPATEEGTAEALAAQTTAEAAAGGDAASTADDADAAGPAPE